MICKSETTYGTQTSDAYIELGFSQNVLHEEYVHLTSRFKTYSQADTLFFFFFFCHEKDLYPYRRGGKTELIVQESGKMNELGLLIINIR